MLPTYNRRPSEMAWGTWGPGRAKAVRDVLVRVEEGEPCGLLVSLFMRQLEELKARPLVRTFW
jgi:hypothetical protein